VRVSLQGTFDTLSVTDLFGLLSTAGKTGALRLEAGELEASVFVTGGLCCAVEADEAGGSAGSRAPESNDELAGRLVDVGFAFARLPEGSFRFSDSELAAYDTSVTTPLERAVVEIRSLLDQWHEIESTIPSLDVRVRLAPVLHHEEIVVTAQEWNLLVALETMPSVRDLVAQRREPMMEVCREIKGLVERGAVEIGADLARADMRLERGSRDAGGHGSDAVVELSGAGDDEGFGAGVGAGAGNAGRPVRLSAVADDADRSAESPDFATDAGAIAAEAEAVAAGIVSRMTRTGHATPDAFAGAEDPDGEAPRGTSERTAPDPGAAGDPSQDRGALLRLFSGLKEN
jgi:Domain of unknown function (DUF4388)